MPTGTGELRRIHSRVSWMFLPVERSMMVSPPQLVAHVIFSTSSSIEEETAELPMFALIFTRKRPADDHRLGLRVIDVGGNDGAPARHFVAHDLGLMPSRRATNSISGVISPRRA